MKGNMHCFPFPFSPPSFVLVIQSYAFVVPVWISLPVLFPRDLFVISDIDFVDELVFVKGFAT